jgi:hypothetical protein
VVREVLTWEADHGSESDDAKTLAGSGLFPIVGWHFLFEGKFSAAAEQLEVCARRQSLDLPAAIWLTEAEWLAGRLKTDADEIAEVVLRLDPAITSQPGALELAWCRVLLHAYANPLVQAELWKTYSGMLIGEATKVEERLGLRPGSLVFMTTADSHISLVRLLDDYATGGRHRERIRDLWGPGVETS